MLRKKFRKLKNNYDVLWTKKQMTVYLLQAKIVSQITRIIFHSFDYKIIHAVLGFGFPI